jgi:hypothetical protein
MVKAPKRRAKKRSIKVKSSKRRTKKAAPPNPVAAAKPPIAAVLSFAALACGGCSRRDASALLEEDRGRCGVDSRTLRAGGDADHEHDSERVA